MTPEESSGGLVPITPKSLQGLQVAVRACRDLLLVAGKSRQSELRVPISFVTDVPLATCKLVAMESKTRFFSGHPSGEREFQTASMREV